MFTITTHNVPSLKEDIRLYDYCTSIFNKYIPSRKGIKKALKRGEIWVNNNQGNTGDWVKEGQTIELRDLELNPPKAYPLDFEIIFEDEYIAIINKPSGISVSGNQYRTIQNAIIDKIRLSTQQDALKWPRPVHRLDNQTSGLLVIAKTATAIINLSKQFENREVDKKYHAIVMGDPNSTGEIQIPINEQKANSSFIKIKTIDSIKSGKLSLVELKPHTGRTHQLRIHCAESGFPILGDKIYGEKGNTLLHKGLFLCATNLKFDHPHTNTEISFEIPIPYKFENRIKKELEMFSKTQL